VTLRDIARALNLSLGTVSKALRKSPEIPEPTRQRVQEMADEMGYQPNPMGAALARFKQDSKLAPLKAELAILNLWPDPKHPHSVPFLEGQWKGALQCAEKHGYRLEEFTLDQTHSLRRIEQILLSRAIHGILLPTNPMTKEELSQLNWSKFSVVTLTTSCKLDFHSVVVDGPKNGMMAFEKIREKGYRRIAWVGNPRFAFSMHGAGFLLAQSAMPASDRLPPLLISPEAPSNSLEEFRSWLKEHKPDAIYTDNRQLPQMLAQCGYRVPEDIGLAATAVPDAGISAGIDQHPQEVGRVGILTLISLMHDRDLGVPALSRSVGIPGHWVDGPSLPRRR
jgi:DNA-binding LacI/PurR family transcriptional regulator